MHYVQIVYGVFWLDDGVNGEIFRINGTIDIIEVLCIIIAFNFCEFDIVLVLQGESNITNSLLFFLFQNQSKSDELTAAIIWKPRKIPIASNTICCGVIILLLYFTLE